MGGSSTSEDFSVFVLASDLGIDARPFLSASDRQTTEDHHQSLPAPADDNWHDCPSDLPADEDFSDLEFLQFFRLENGSDKDGNRIFRIVGKYFPGKTRCPPW